MDINSENRAESRIGTQADTSADNQLPTDEGGDEIQTQARKHRKKSPMFNARVTSLDRWLVRKMLDVVGNPPVRISLWTVRK